MVSYKTPKSSTTKARLPSTPRAKQPKQPKQPKRPREKTDPNVVNESGTDVPTKVVKKKKASVSEITAKSTASCTEVANAGPAGNTGIVPVQKKAKAKAKAESTMYTKTLLDNLDPETLQGQHSRTHQWMKICLDAALTKSTDGIVDTSDVPNFVAPVRDVAQTDLIKLKVPIAKLRFSKKSTSYIRFLLGNAYKAKINDLHTLNALTGKQTMSMPLIWAERQYRASLDLVATGAKNNMAGTSTDELTASMLSDLYASQNKSLSPCPAPGAPFILPQCKWDAFVRTHKSMKLHNEENVADLGAIADKVFGCSGVWSHDLCTGQVDV